MYVLLMPSEYFVFCIFFALVPDKCHYRFNEVEFFYPWIDVKIICALKTTCLSKKVLGQSVILKIWIHLSKIASSFLMEKLFKISCGLVYSWCHISAKILTDLIPGTEL